MDEVDTACAQTTAGPEIQTGNRIAAARDLNLGFRKGSPPPGSPSTPIIDLPAGMAKPPVTLHHPGHRALQPCVQRAVQFFVIVWRQRCDHLVLLQSAQAE